MREPAARFMPQASTTPGPLDRIALRLRRITTSGRYMGELDGLRFVAIAWVVLMHIHHYSAVSVRHVDSPFGSFWGWLLDLGNLGVPLFFAISGFILALPFAEYHLATGREVSLRQYFLRRLTRLEPPFIAAMLVAFVLHVIKGGVPLGELTRHLGATIAYLHNLIYQHHSTINGVAWSLEIEVQFYICVPALALVFRLPTVARRVALGVAILLLAWAMPSFWMKQGVAQPDLYLIGHLHFFLIGFVLADLFITRPVALEVNPVLWDLLGLFGCCATPFAYADKAMGWLWFPLSIGLFYLGAMRGTCLRRLLNDPVIATLGGMCYTIYLIHLPIVSGVIKVSKRLAVSDYYLPNLFLQIAIMLPLILVPSIIFYALVERPCMNKNWPWELAAWCKARLPGGRSAPPPSPPFAPTDTPGAGSSSMG